MNAVKLSNGKLIAFCENITERKQSEASLFESEKKYKDLYDNAPAMFASVDYKTGEVIDCNKQLIEKTGYSEKEIIGHHILERYHTLDAATKAFQSFMKTGVVKNAQLQLKKKKGGVIDAILNVTSVKDDKRNLLYSRSVWQDITERKKTEKELERIFDLSPDMVCVCTTEGRLLKVSPSCEKILGYTQEELLKIGWSKLVHPDDVETTNKKVEKQLKGSSVANFINRYRHKDGSYVVLEWQASFAEKGIVYATARDITERNKVQERLKQNETKLRAISENSPIHIMLLDKNQTILFINHTAPDLTKEEVIGQSALNFIPPDYHKIATDVCKHVWQTGKSQSYTTKYVTKDGKTKYYDVQIGPLLKSGKVSALISNSLEITDRKENEEKIKALAKFPSENPNPVLRIKKDGTILFSNKAAQNLSSEQKPDEKQQFFEQIQQSVLASLSSGLSKEVEVKSEDKIFSFVFAPVVESGYVNVYGRDVTGRKKVENALTGAFDEVALVNEKLGVVGRLTRHDVRNKLSSVLGNLYLAKQNLHPSHVTTKYLKHAESEIDQIEKIFDFARMYEQLGGEELSYVDVGKSFDVAVSLLQDLGKIEIVNDCKGCSVLADSLLEQLFYNLMDNSLKHGEKVSKIRIYCKTNKDQLKLVYEDDGVGIPEDEKEKIFGEGYGKGTGVGLHMIKIMCNIYGWIIKETCKQDKGAQFTITIPRTNKNGQIGYRLQ